MVMFRKCERCGLEHPATGTVANACATWFTSIGYDAHNVVKAKWEALSSL